MTRVEFGRELETIDEAAFNYHPALQSINMPSVRIIGYIALFAGCCIKHLDLPESLERNGGRAFVGCDFGSITIPLKYYDMVPNDDAFIEVVTA